MEDMMNTLYKHNMLPAALKTKYSKTSTYYSPAVMILSKRYNVDINNFDNCNKLKVRDIKRYIVEHEKNQLFKKYLYLVMINKTNNTIGFSLAYNFIKNDLENSFIKI